MDARINGTCWGERNEEEIQIPAWLTPEWKELDRKIEIATEYYEERGRARGRREGREQQNHRANQWQAAAITLIIFSLCALAEWVCR